MSSTETSDVFGSGNQVELNLRDRAWIQIICDFAVTVVSGVIALCLWNLEAQSAFGLDWLVGHAHWLPIFSVGTLLVFGMTGLYMRTDPYNFSGSVRSVISGLFLVIVLYYTVYFFAPKGALPRLVVLFYLVTSLPLFILWRLGLRRITSERLVQKNIIIVGRSGAVRELMRLLEENPFAGIHAVGAYPLIAKEAQNTDDETGRRDLRQLDPDRALTRYVQRLDVSEIVIFGSGDEIPDPLLEQFVECYRRGVTVKPGLELIEDLTGRFPLKYAGERWERMFPTSKEDRGIVYQSVKRTMDIAGSVVGLLLFLPLLPVLSAAIKVTSKGPVFFRQERSAQGGDTFTIVKLRTMVQDAEEQSGVQWAEEQDPRVTSVGWFLRKTHLDEFPQFWNVLKGDMSLVGPRPERPEIEDELTDPNPFFKLRHSVKPGVTGWATIKNQYVDSVEKAERRLEYDLYYIEHQSFWMDLHILFETVWELVTFGGR